MLVGGLMVWSRKSYLGSDEITCFRSSSFIQGWTTWCKSNVSSFISDINLGNEEVV